MNMQTEGTTRSDAYYIEAPVHSDTSSQSIRCIAVKCNGLILFMLVLQIHYS